MIFDQGFLPLALDTPVSNCKAAVLVLVHPGYDWKIGHISVIHKKGKKDEYENYRGITVLNIFSRLYGKILKQFLEQEFFQIETVEQPGFRGGRSTIDHIFC